MKYVSVAMLSLFFVASGGMATEEPLQHKLAELFAKTHLEPIHRIADLPSAVASLLDVHGTFSMADPDRHWNPGCVHDSENPEPDRRLVAAGKSNSLIAVHYEQGGYAVFRVLQLLLLAPDGEVAGRCVFFTSSPGAPLSHFRRKFPADFDLNRCEQFTSVEPAA